MMERENWNNDEKLVYVDANTGARYDSKPETMTQIRGNKLVSKSHPRIQFRGEMDSLLAEILLLQKTCYRKNKRELLGRLEELKECVCEILACEVKETPLSRLQLWGMDDEKLRELSHHPQEYFQIPHSVPQYSMGEVALSLNHLRTQVRKVERSFLQVMEHGHRYEVWEQQIALWLNRLSSAVYILYCQSFQKEREGASGILRESENLILVEASGSHVHLDQKAFRELFGEDQSLTKRRALSQGGEFLSEQRVSICTEHGCLEHVAVLGPLRDAVQVEISVTDSKKLGIHPPIRLSGNLSQASTVTLVSDFGKYVAEESAIIAQNHIHMNPQEASAFGVKDGECVRIQVDGVRPVIFEQVPIRIKDSFHLAMHIDMDEANSCGFYRGMKAKLCHYGCQDGQAEKGQPEQCKMEISQKALEQSFGGRATDQQSVIVQNKKLLTEADALELVRTYESPVFQIQSGVLVTPSAKDVFLHHRRALEVSHAYM